MICLQEYAAKSDKQQYSCVLKSIVFKWYTVAIDFFVSFQSFFRGLSDTFVVIFVKSSGEMALILTSVQKLASFSQL